MKALEIIEKVVDAAGVIDDGLTLIGGLVRRIRERKWDQVDEVLPVSLKTELAMAAAEEKARAKFGASS